MTFSVPVIKKLLQESAFQLRELEKAYFMIPATNCDRKALCCSMLPEMSLVEALSGVRGLLESDRNTRNRLLIRIVKYYFLNPVEITTCPFLEDRNCLIYGDRFFGCRAYGLWSAEHYEKLQASSRKAKQNLQRQWENLGVHLPDAVVEFTVPYCKKVKQVDGIQIDDTLLLKISGKIEQLSESFSVWHDMFYRKYFCDMSFLLTSLMFGFFTSVQMKFSLVRDQVATGNKSELENILKALPDVF